MELNKELALEELKRMLLDTSFDFNNIPTPQMDQGFQQTNTFINTEPNLNTEYVNQEINNQPIYQQPYVEPVEPVVVPTVEPIMQDTPLFNPAAFEVPVVPEPQVEIDKLSKLQELLNSNGYNYKVYSNETDNCVIIELPKN